MASRVVSRVGSRVGSRVAASAVPSAVPSASSRPFRDVSKLVPPSIHGTGRGNISAKILRDSFYKNRKGAAIPFPRITTYEIDYPRFIHGELMTHRAGSKNSSSSRAVPISKAIQNIRDNTAMPIHWGRHQRGMQAEEEQDATVTIRTEKGVFNLSREDAWLYGRDSALALAAEFGESKYHKQIVNRLTEPYQMMKVVFTATEFDNFFNLRCHRDAQPEIQELANLMYLARAKSKPVELENGEYHLPYITPEIWEQCVIKAKNSDSEETAMDIALRLSASCCAQVSYRTTDTSVDKANKIYKMLIESEPMHASPLEHQARPVTFDDQEDFHIKPVHEHIPLTHLDRYGNYWSGNLKNWVQYRHEIPNNTCHDCSPDVGPDSTIDSDEYVWV